MAERCGLFVIIALGESILVSSAKFADLPWTVDTVAAFVVAFLGSVAMWWLYFNIGAETAKPAHRGVERSGAAARLAYTYMHLPLVAGIIVAAVGDELVLVHPTGHTDIKTAVTLLAGPALYLLAAFCSSGRPPTGRRCRILWAWCFWLCWYRRRSACSPWRLAASRRWCWCSSPSGRRCRCEG